MGKNFKNLNELKATKLNKQTKEHILKKTRKIDFKIFSMVLDKKHPVNLIHLKKCNKNDLYMELTYEL